MSSDPEFDIASVRRRFPWVALVNTGEGDLAARYREMMARHRPDERDEVDTGDAGYASNNPA